MMLPLSTLECMQESRYGPNSAQEQTATHNMGASTPFLTYKQDHSLTLVATKSVQLPTNSVQAPFSFAQGRFDVSPHAGAGPGLSTPITSAFAQNSYATKKLPSMSDLMWTSSQQSAATTT